MAPETEFAALHLPLVLQELSSLLLLARQQSSVLLLARTPLLDAAEDQKADEDTENSESADDDAALGASRQCLPVVANARGVLDLLEHFGLAGRAEKS